MQDGCIAQATVERDCSSPDKVSSTQSQSLTQLMHLLGNQLLYSLIIDPCLAGGQLIYMLREGMLEVADTLPDSGRGEYFRTSEYFGTSLLVSFRAA